MKTTLRCTARALIALGLVATSAAIASAQSPTDALASWIAFAAPPGAEEAAATALQQALPGWTADRWGNLIRRVGSGTPRRVVACAMDQSAYVVSQITDDGYLRLRRTGTPRHPLWDQFHEAQRVHVFTAAGTHPGVIAVPNGHFARQHIADSTALTFDNLWVDVGATSRAKVEALGIALIDPVALDRPSWAFADHATGVGAGARAGCAAVAAAGEAAARNGVTSGETIFVLSTQRIFGWVGLSTALVQLPPITSLHLLDEGQNARSVTSSAAGRLPRAFRALESRVSADSVHVFAPAVRFVASAVETIAAREAEDALSWVTRAAAVRGTPAFTPLSATGTTRAPASPRDTRLDPLGDQFMRLADLPGVPGHEQLVRDAILSAMPAWARTQATIDSAGNLVLAMGPDRDAIAFVAHMDEVGFEVDRILPDGQVTLRRLGGAVLSSWEGVPALLHFDPVGTAAPSPALRGVFVPRTAGSTKTPDRLTAWFGYDSAQLVARGVRSGHSITAYKRADRLAGHKVTARGSDDRTGSTALLAALAGMDPSTLTRRVYFTWTVREEGGLNGARAFGNMLGRTLSFVYSIDTFVSSDTPLESPHFAYTPLGAGAVLRSLDDGSLTPRRERTRIITLAREAGIPLQVGTTQGSTDGSAIVPWGPPNIGLSWPGRFSHGPAEVLDVRDVDALARLIRVVAEAP